ncbi:anthranilate synthase component I [Anoxynatronum buryatiense]|uniref:Anthranilate synthase component 1 n=1 Tax=Anoxynatronum buryatiense TaxID=489973 RepID=A0AA46AJF4_9CLOT|nr:anthranilate synthase component I [Anoxynatronum buryatiense]SMP61690.1 anthranilate synthase, component I [Anoxynatronum buryatiense]
MITWETFQQMAAQQKRICLKKEVGGDMETPISLYQKLKQPGGSFLLESVADGVQRGRYSYMGSCPTARLSSRGLEWQLKTVPNADVMRKSGAEGQQGQGRVLEKLQQLLQPTRLCSETSEEGPDFTGGAVGFMAYDTIRQYERLPDETEDDLGLPEACFLLVDELAAYDHARQIIILMVNVLIPEKPVQLPRLKVIYEAGLARMEQMEERVRQPLIIKTGVSEGSESRWGEKNAVGTPQLTSTETMESFSQKVKVAKEYIRQGDIFQVVLSQRYTIQPAPDPLDTYRALRSQNPSPYLFFLDYGDFQLTGASPEMLVQTRQRRVETCPIAGTRPRGKTPEEDDAYAAEMLADDKERAEHLMLVDLARNDVGRVAAFGSVTVAPYMVVKKFSHVMHLVSQVQGELAPGNSAFDALISCLPAGTLSGAPKIRAMEIIDQLETKRRGPYGGAVGYVGYNGSMDTCITIRSVVFHEGKAHVQAGAGIVEDSIPASEYEESRRKAASLLEILCPQGGRAYDDSH